MSTIAQERAEVGYALDADEGEAFWLLGMLQTIKIGKDDTAGKYGLLEIVGRKASARRGTSIPRRTSGSTSSKASSPSG